MKEEKRMVGSYEVIACQRIGGEEIIVGEDKNAAPSERYLCCYVEQNDIFERYSSALASDGYAEIFEIYGQRIASAAKEVIERIDKEKTLIGDSKLIFTADKCEPLTEEVNLTERLSLSTAVFSALSISLQPISLCFARAVSEHSLMPEGEAAFALLFMTDTIRNFTGRIS